MTASSVAIATGRGRLGWSTNELWVAAIGVGGSMTPGDVAAIAAGTQHATSIQHDILVTAMNDRFTELGQDHPLACWADLPPSAP